MKTNKSQVAKGKKRAATAHRNAKGQFLPENQPVKETTGEISEKTGKEATKHPAQKPAEHTTEHATGETSKSPAGHPAARPAGEQAEKPVQNVVNPARPAGKTSEKPAEIQVSPAEPAARPAQNAVNPAESPAESPAGSPAETSSLYTVVVTAPPARGEEESRPFEEFIDRAMEDEYWKNLVVTRTGLPLFEKEKEAIVLALFKHHVIYLGKEYEIRSVKKAKNYFANFTKRGTEIHRRILEALKQHRATGEAEDRHLHEDVDPKTGQRSYCGIPIPQEAPPRPDKNAVWNTRKLLWER